jgi:5-formyltetrahydrofolate cyclo-ligase
VRFEGFGQLSLDRYGIRSVSGTDVVINPHEIALVLVPGVGFAKNGNRIGMGAGYYDRFLAQVDKAVLMGVTYNALLCSKIPVDYYDKPVQYLVTETNVTLCE